MEVLDKAKHCQEEFCHQIDLLPMQCKACKKSFCAAHFKYDNHKCTESAKLDYKIPECKICNKTIEFKRDKDLDLCLAEHMQKCFISNISNRSSTQPKKVTAEKSKAKKCMYKNCKTKEIFSFNCDTCQHTFCTKHRVPEIHKCSELLKSCSAQFNQTSNQASQANPTNQYSQLDPDDEYDEYIPIEIIRYTYVPQGYAYSNAPDYYSTNY